MEIEGRTVVVTGAARGIGRGIAEGFARAGARVVVADLGSLAGDWAYRLSSKDELEATARDIEKAGGKALAVEVDVSSADSCRRMIDSAVDVFGGLDVLVNNAGVIKAGGLGDYDERDWDKLFAVNVKGVFLASRAALPALVTGGGGAIVNIASIAGKRGYPGLSAYSASKFAVVGLTQAMAAELAPVGIRANAICPGLLQTAMWTDHLQKMMAPLIDATSGEGGFEAFVRQNTPLGRRQTPADIAQAALYLACADNVTGIALNVAGGSEMG